MPIEMTEEELRLARKALVLHETTDPKEQAAIDALAWKITEAIAKQLKGGST